MDNVKMYVLGIAKNFKVKTSLAKHLEYSYTKIKLEPHESFLLYQKDIDFITNEFISDGHLDIFEIPILITHTCAYDELLERNPILSELLHDMD